MSMPGSEVAGGAALVRFAQSLSDASSFDALDRTFRAGFGPLLDVPMWGFNVLDPETGRLQRNTVANVSDVMVARYLDVMDDDPLRRSSHATGRAVYNLALMSLDEWEESSVYRHALSIHRMRHVIEVPMHGAGRIVGALHFAGAGSDRSATGSGASTIPERDFASADLRVAEALGRVLGHVVARIQDSDRKDREHEQALAALEMTGTAIVISNPHATEPRLNRAARLMLDEVVDAEDRLYQLLGRAPDGGGFSRRTAVDLKSGETATLHAHSNEVPEGGLVTVLELQRHRPAIASGAITVLSPRETEVATLVAEGLSDREIATCLHLSKYTVTQHVKRIYRKLDVDSRVGLTRLMLGAPVSARRH